MSVGLLAFGHVQHLKSSVSGKPTDGVWPTRVRSTRVRESLWLARKSRTFRRRLDSCRRFGTRGFARRGLQMSNPLIEVLIHATDHRRVPMSHQFGQRDGVHAAFQSVGRERVPKVVGAQIRGDSSFQVFAQAAETTTNRVGDPGAAELVSAERSLRILEHQALGNGPRRGSEINHPRSAGLTARLVLRRGEHPQPLFGVHVPRFDEPDLLRPGTGFLNQREVVMEALVLDRFENRRELLGAENRFTAFGGRLTKCRQGGEVEVALFDSPVIGPLDAADGTAAAVGPPAGMFVEPRRDPEGTQVRRQKVHRHRAGELRQEIRIVAVTASMILGPFQETGDQLPDGQLGGHHRNRGRVERQLVPEAKGFAAVRGLQVDLLAVERDEPGIATLTKPGRRSTFGHEKTSRLEPREITRAGPEGLPHPRSIWSIRPRILCHFLCQGLLAST